MQIGKLRRAICAGIIALVFPCTAVIAYDDQETHKLLTKSATENSTLNDYLRAQLSFSSGVDTKMPANTGIAIRLLLQEGSKQEDALSNCRASNHFHNPLVSWNISAMSDEPRWLDALCIGWKPWYSNITWATGMTTTTGASSPRPHQDMGWDDARHYFHSALTSTTSTDREAGFAKTFLSVGHVLHLLQDMAVPAHVRNDFRSHLAFNGVTSIRREIFL